MDVLNLSCKMKDNLSDLLFHHAPDTRDHGLELLSNYSSSPDMEIKLSTFLAMESLIYLVQNLYLSTVSQTNCNTRDDRTVGDPDVAAVGLPAEFCDA